MIKVCVNPTCEELAHNCKAGATYCKNCGGRMIKINNTTYWSKYLLHYWQYDYLKFPPELMHPDRPNQPNRNKMQLSLFNTEEDTGANITEDL